LKVIITGAGGQLGRELQLTAVSGVECIALTRAELDIGDADAVADCIAGHRPQLVINAAAYTAVDKAESEPEACRRINADGPRNLAIACAANDCRLIHVSTDFVFSGQSSRPYLAADATAPLGEYGRSKLAGEQAVIDAHPTALIMRTGWVYSRFGGNFVKTMLRLMTERDALGVVADQVGTPTWARALAQALWAAAAKPRVQGIYHFSDAGVCSWYDFAVAIEEEGRASGILAGTTAVGPIQAAQYPTPASRPAYSVLDKTDTWNDLAITPIHWRAQLRAMLRDMKEHNHE
jgi:dTDP-4-dehydrorhamnose reductase